jgi:2-C-methyl-D-erythritol 4-phosphate cytidylyltransferase
MEKKWFAVIVAGGSGTRMGSELPKQFIELNGIPILMHTLKLFSSFLPQPEIVLVLPKNQFDAWSKLCSFHSFSTKYTLIAGGETRFHSVKNGLAAIAGEGLVAIHDGVRPFVSFQTLERCLQTAAEKGSAIPVVKPSESVRLGTLQLSQSLDRDTFWLVQTPQVFTLKIIKECYQTEWSDLFTDDASVAEKGGVAVTLVEGNYENIKITTPHDLLVANAILKSR